MILRILPILLIVAGCSEPYALNKEAAVTQTVTPAGLTITAPTGDILVVPAGAVTENVDVTLTPFAAPADEDGYVSGGVRLEPDGLRFLIPATLTLALSTSQTPGSILKFHKGPNDLSEILDMAYPFVVGANGRTASEPIYGFSGQAVARNCHTGTMNRLLTAWQGINGRSSSDIAKRAVAGLKCEGRPCTTSDFDTTQLDANMLQKGMGDFFTPCGSFATGSPVTQAARDQIKATIDKGLLVVMMFSGNGATIKTSTVTGLFESLIHSAVVVNDDGKLVIRNKPNLARPKVVPNFNTVTSGDVAPDLDLPLDEIDAEKGLRDKRNGEVSLELLGTPMTDEERAARPDRSWSNVIIFCEKPRDNTTMMCGAEAKPNGSCGGGQFSCIGQMAACEDSTGNTCCPAGMCNYFGSCIQLTCPEGAGRNYDCECCCTAGMGGTPGSCSNTATIFNVFDSCRGDRLCACASSAPTTDMQCP